MISLKKASGTFKGLIGECMFRIANPNSILTHFQPKDLVMRQLSEIYDPNQIRFLNDNWHTIDAIDVVEPKIYEIKTKSCNYGEYKIPMMANCHNAMKKASKIGIRPVLIKVILEEDWLYKIVESNYLEEDFYIVTPNKYNKPYGILDQ